MYKYWKDIKSIHTYTHHIFVFLDINFIWPPSNETHKKKIILQSSKRMGKVTIFRNPTIFHVLCEFYGYFQNRFYRGKEK